MEWLRALLTLSILLAYLPFSTLAQITGLVDTAVLLGEDTTLYCRNSAHSSGFAQWSDNTNVPAVPFASRADGVQRDSDEYAKYANFDLDTTSPITQLDLIINNAELEDEGTYSCTLSPGTAAATLSVEITGTKPSIEVENGSPGTDEAVFTCSADGYRPAVGLEWFKKGDNMTDSSNPNTPDDNGDGTSDSSSTLTLPLTDQDDGATIECKTTGQKAALPQSRSIILSKPEVTVDFSNGRLTCSSNGAIPAATSYEIIVNATKVEAKFDTSGQSVAIEPDACSTVSCNVTNLVGTGTAVLPNKVCPGGLTLQPGIIVVIVLIPIVLLLCLLGLLICYKKRMFCFDSNKTTNGASPAPKKQPSSANADMIRNQPEVRQSVHKYEDEPKKPRVPRSSTGGNAGKQKSPQKDALRQNAPPDATDHKGYPMDSYDGNTEKSAGQGGLNYADLEFKGRQGETNGSGKIHQDSEPTTYASILV